MARQALGKGLGALIMRKQEAASAPVDITEDDNERVIVANISDIKV